MVEFTDDLGELSVFTVLRFWPLGCRFLHKGGGATPDNYRRGEQKISNFVKKNGHATHSINQSTSIHIW